MLVTSLASLSYVLHQKPFIEKDDFKTECLNELVIFLFYLLLFIYLNPVMDENVREKFGYFLIGFICCSILLNLSN